MINVLTMTSGIIVNITRDTLTTNQIHVYHHVVMPLLSVNQTAKSLIQQQQKWPAIIFLLANN